MTDQPPRRRGREKREGWTPFPLTVPPDVNQQVRELAARDAMAPSLNTVYVTLLREALAARAARKR
jgi:hypothetical protein